jgi:hypothetical protein
VPAALDDHHFGSLIMLAVTAGAFLLVVWVATKALFPATLWSEKGRWLCHAWPMKSLKI